ncbi:MAG: alpha/beta fold hydrolase [Pseudomonadales bacterium]|nr:alpha/beta fold hydrolase [Pseudomonadales bacterium]MBO7005830.1 alpha/beta fold hydrolase [Pseudomonadales bacterium]
MRNFLALVLLVACCSLQAAETPVTIEPGWGGKSIEGKLMLPKTRDLPRRVVLLLHGFQGQMDEVGNLYADLAEQLAEQRIASLRINFSGEGERNDYVAESTFESRVGEAEAALNFLKTRYPGAAFGVVGFSLGGLTTMGLMGRHPEAFQSVVLWSAAQEMRMTGNESYDKAVRDAVKNGRASYQDWTDITLTREFVNGFVGVNTARFLKQYHGALLTIRGDRDFLPTHDPAWLKLSPSNDKSFLMIGGADHIFNVLEDPQPNYPARVLVETSRWFVRTL